jgi:hypothetical protein
MARIHQKQFLANLRDHKVPHLSYGNKRREDRPVVQSSRSDSRRYQIFCEIVGLGRGPFSLLSTTEELLGRKRSGFGLETRDYGRRDPPR